MAALNPAAKEGIDYVEEVDSRGHRDPKGAAALVLNHYEPATEEEKSLDRRINMKLDLCVTLLLSIGFILCGSACAIACLC
jgi:hypothetical protein